MVALETLIKCSVTARSLENVTNKSSIRTRVFAVYVTCSLYIVSIIKLYSTAIVILYYLGVMQFIVYDSCTIETKKVFLQL